VTKGPVRRIYWQKWNTICIILFSTVHKQLKLRTAGRVLFMESAMLHPHISTVAQNRQTKHWLYRESFVFKIIYM